VCSAALLQFFTPDASFYRREAGFVEKRRYFDAAFGKAGSPAAAAKTRRRNTLNGAETLSAAEFIEFCQNFINSVSILRILFRI
jgi:hypothetical protein